MFCLPLEVNKSDDGHVKSHNFTSNRASNMISVLQLLFT